MRLAQTIAGRPDLFKKKFLYYKKPDPSLYKKRDNSKISRPCYIEDQHHNSHSPDDCRGEHNTDITDLRHLLPIFSPGRYYKEVNSLKIKEEKLQARKVR